MESYTMINPCRIPCATASVRLDTLSLPKIELMWNFTVCFDMPRRAPISLVWDNREPSDATTDSPTIYSGVS